MPVHFGPNAQAYKANTMRNTDILTILPEIPLKIQSKIEFSGKC